MTRIQSACLGSQFAWLEQKCPVPRRIPGSIRSAPVIRVEFSGAASENDCADESGSPDQRSGDIRTGHAVSKGHDE